MEDIIDQLRLQRLNQPPLPTHEFPSARTQFTGRRSAYHSTRLRLRAGLVGSIILMLVVASLAPLYLHNIGYLACYIIVQLITIIRVLIAIQMNLTLPHINPSRSVSEVSDHVARLELIHQWDRRYTLFVKVPLTICVVALLLPPLGLDPFNVRWILYLWLAVAVIVSLLNFVVAYLSFRRLEQNIENLKDKIQ